MIPATFLAEKLQDPEFRKIEGFPIGEDEESVHWVEDEEVALAADALVVHVVKAPAYRPALAEAAQLVRDLDLGFVAVFGGTVVEPAGHGVMMTLFRCRHHYKAKTIASVS